jgi:alpha 1,3-glucosidase
MKCQRCIYCEAKERAVGDYYLDDGETFNYENGQYIYKSLKYENSKLSCTPKEAKDGQFETTTRVEKVTLLIPNHKDKNVKEVHVTETRQGSTDKRKAEFSIMVDGSQARLEIKDPAVNVANNWEIEIVWV